MPRVEPPVQTRGRPLKSLKRRSRLGISQLWGVGVVVNVRDLGGRWRWRQARQVVSGERVCGRGKELHGKRTRAEENML